MDDQFGTNVIVNSKIPHILNLVFKIQLWLYLFISNLKYYDLTMFHCCIIQETKRSVKRGLSQKIMIGSLFFNRIFYTRYFRTWDNIFNNLYVNRYFHKTTGACEIVYQSFEMWEDFLWRLFFCYLSYNMFPSLTSLRNFIS